jgi:hypothetical protein
MTATAERIALLSGWVRVALEGERLSWFDATLEGLRAGGGQRELVRAVGLAPRKLGKNDLALSTDDLTGAERARPGFDPGGLTVDQAARIAFLLAAAERDEASFPHSLADLYRTAELAESIAYLRGLPLFPAPRALLTVASEGVRSAVKPVFEAVAHRSPYPREIFDESAWNQMVLKALFIGSELAPIQGLDERANPDLAEVLLDYAHERWAAGRSVSPELWRCVGPFAHGRALKDLERVAATGTTEERDAALQALRASPAAGAAAILARYGQNSSLST